METILLEGGGVGLVIQTIEVGFVVGKQPIALLPAMQCVGIQMGQGWNRHRLCCRASRFAAMGCHAHGQAWLVWITPGPGIPHPNRGQQRDWCCCRTPIDNPDLDQDVGG